MRFNARFSALLGWSLLALLMTMFIKAEARSANRSDHVYGYVDGIDQPLVECAACGPQRGFRLDDELLYKLVTQSENLAIRLMTSRSIPVTKLVFRFTGPAGEQLEEITQTVEQNSSRTQIVLLTKETAKALQAHIGKHNHLNVIVETKTSTGREKMHLQLVTLSKIRS